MKDFDMKKPEMDKAEITECMDHGHEDMDPVGYFLVRYEGDNIEAGLCDYDKPNIIKKVWKGKKPQDVYRQIVKDVSEIRKDHVGYLSKELTRAWICMKLGVQFIQDGRMDGTFPEVEDLVRKQE